MINRKYSRLTKRRKHSLKKQSGGANMKYAVLAIFKNEAMGIAEWVEHYLWQGADMILLLNNNSDDGWEQALAKFDKTKVVVLPAEKSYAQAEHYSEKGLPWLRENAIDIVSVLDIDKFLFCKDGRPLKEYFTTTFLGPNAPSYVVCKWKMFGSNGYVEQPQSIRKSFLCCKTDIATSQTKSTYLVKNLKDRIEVHVPNPGFGKVLEASNMLQLNHYAIQSKEYFEKVKISRGDVLNPNFNSTRDWNYFKNFDYCEEKDELLKNLLEA
jgi:hypothetical protein